MGFEIRIEPETFVSEMPLGTFHRMVSIGMAIREMPRSQKS